MKEDKEVFLKVDRVEPVYKGVGDCSRIQYLDGARIQYLGGVRVWIGAYGYFFPCDSYTICEPDEVRRDGRRQTMDLAIELADMSNFVKKDLFGVMSVKDIFLKFPYEAIKEKVDAWKKEKEKIRVRDEVVNINSGCKIVVTVPPKMSSNSVEYMSGIDKSGKVYKDVVAAAYKKTGLHVDDLDPYLEV